jgi:hypothetical protein
MPAPTLVSSVPATSSVGISIEQQVILTFSTALDAGSVNEGTVSVFRSDDLVPLRGEYVLSSASTVVTFTPERAFFQDTQYRVVLLGSDQGLGYAVKSSTGEFLATTSVISFRTGTPRYVSLEEIAARDDIERVGPIREADPLAIQPTAGSLEIDELVPEAYESNVSVSATGLHIDFSADIDPSTVTTTSVKIEQAPVLGIIDYYATIVDPASSTVPTLGVQDSATDFTPPTGELRVEGDKVVFEIDPAADFLHNTEVHVTISTDVASTTGASLSSETEYFFTTEYFPLFVGASFLRTELGPSIATLTDDTLNRIIHKNSIEAWEMSGQGISLERPTWWARKWVICKSILDILGVLLLTSDLQAGQSKTLGDLSISTKPANPELGAKYKQATDCLVELGNLFGMDLMATTAVKGAASGTERNDFRMRTWDHLILQRRGSANTSPERNEKGRLSLDYSLGGKAAYTQLFFLSVDLLH